MEYSFWRPEYNRHAPYFRPVVAEQPAKAEDTSLATPELTAPAASGSSRVPEYLSNTMLSTAVENTSPAVGPATEFTVPPVVAGELPAEAAEPLEPVGEDVPGPQAAAENRAKLDEPKERPLTAEVGGPPEPPIDLPPFATEEPPRPEQPFGVDHFEEPIPDPDMQKEMAKNLKASMADVVERNIDYVDTDPYYHGTLDLDVIRPEGRVHLNIDPGHAALLADFYHTDGKLSGHTYRVTEAGITRTDIDLSMYEEQAETPPGRLPHREASEHTTSYYERVAPAIEEEVSHGLNDLPIGNDQLVYLYTLLRDAVPTPRPAIGLVGIATQRIGPYATPVSREDARLACAAFDTTVFRFTQNRGYDYTSSIVTSFKGKVSDDLGSAEWQAGYRRSADQRREPFVHVSLTRTITPADFEEGEIRNPRTLERIKADGFVTLRADMDYAHADGELRTITTITYLAKDDTPLGTNTYSVLSDHVEIRHIRNFLGRPLANRRPDY